MSDKTSKISEEVAQYDDAVRALDHNVGEMGSRINVLMQVLVDSDGQDQPESARQSSGTVLGELRRITNDAQTYIIRLDALVDYANGYFGELKAFDK